MMASYETEPPPPGPNDEKRRRSAWLIGAFVLLQFLVPLTYLAREDSSDERFTWRSFMTVEASACESSAFIERADGTREDLDLDKTVHRDWMEYVQQGRRSVVDAFMQRQCEAGDVLQVELVNDCEEQRSQTFKLRCGSGRAHETVRTAAR